MTIQPSATNFQTIWATTDILTDYKLFSLATASIGRDEELSDSAWNGAIVIYKETRPKLVISHTAPSEAAREILKDLNGSYFLNKHGDGQDLAL